MTAVPRVEDLPLVVLPEADMANEDLHHTACCDHRRVRARGERLYAFCGVDLTDDEEVPGGTTTCKVCASLEERPVEWNRKTGRCTECPQDLFNPPTGGKR